MPIRLNAKALRARSSVAIASSFLGLFLLSARPGFAGCEVPVRDAIAHFQTWRVAEAQRSDFVRVRYAFVAHPPVIPGGGSGYSTMAYDLPSQITIHLHP